MSAGTRVYPVRLPADLIEDVEWTIASRNAHSVAMPWTLSDFIRLALREKIHKMMRSRRTHRRPQPSPPLA